MKTDRPLSRTNFHMKKRLCDLATELEDITDALFEDSQPEIGEACRVLSKMLWRRLHEKLGYALKSTTT